METDDKIALLGPPVIVGLTTFLVQIAPSEVLRFLMAWMLVSIPIGVLIGQCALGDE